MAGGVCALALATAAHAQAPRPFDLPAGDLSVTLEAYIRQSGAQLIYQPSDVRGRRSARVSGSLTPEEALDRLLAGTGLRVARDSTGAMMIVRPQPGTAGEGATGDATQVGDIVVTGSRIRGALPTAPVRLVTREEIDRSGFGQTGEIVRSLPENFSGGQNPGVLGATAGNINNTNQSNASTVNLRGLGTDATLVLVNGRRLSGDFLYQGADISGIPLSAIDRIEVVTDGSSAVYGSDAVAGVVNFILRRDFDGVELAGRFGGATNGGGFQQTYTALGGVSRDSWHVLANAEYSKQDAIKASDRDFTDEMPPDVDLLRAEERTSFYSSLGADITSRISATLDVLASERRATSISQSTLAAPQYQVDVTTPAYSVGGSVDFTLSDTWKLTTTGVHSSSESKFWQVSPAIRSNTHLENSTQYFEITAEGVALSLPGGDLRVAVGGGYRDEIFDQGSETSATVVSGSRNVSYLFGELYAPLISPSATRVGLNELAVSMSARVEDYSDFGSTTNPKVGLRYVPIPQLSLRGTWGKSFKAPSFTQMISGQPISLYNASTFGWTGGGTALWVTGSNPNLRPEESTSWTLGGEYRPWQTSDATFSATYFDIDYTDRVIVPISPSSRALVDAQFAPFIQRNPTPEEQAAVIAAGTSFRNSTTTPYDPSNVVAILFNNYANATSQKISGVDLSYRQSFELPLGEVSAFANMTWTEVVQQTIPGTPEATKSGTIGNVPDLRARAGLTWSKGGLSATGTINHVSDSTDTGVVPAVGIGSWTTFDANVSYTFQQSDGPLSGVQIALSAINLFDRAPPYAASPSRLQQGLYFDSTTASAVGRFVALNIRKRF